MLQFFPQMSKVKKNCFQWIGNVQSVYVNARNSFEIFDSSAFFRIDVTNF